MQLIYSCTRNHQWDKLIHLCETTFHKKGNDDFLILYWRAFVFGKIGDKKECFRCLESFQGRKDLQFSISMAKLHFSKVFYSNDHENIESLESELLVTEDLTVYFLF